MKITRHYWIPAAVVIALVAALGYAFAPRPVVVELARVTQGALRSTINEDGRTRIKERYIVSAPLGGQLRRIELHPGDKVVAGRTPIATIDPATPELLDPRVRAQLEARLRAAEAQVQLAGARFERGRVANELAQAELTRGESLIANQALARQEFDRMREAARGAAEDLKSADYARQIAGFEAEQARAALLRSAPERCRGEQTWELTITSPIDGRVLRVFHEDAALVPASARLVEVGDPADLEVEIDVLSSDAVQIRRGARVFIEQWGGDQALEGRVRLVEPAGFMKISALGVEEQRVNVIVDFAAPPDQRRGLGDAYRVESRIVVWESERVNKAPVGALFRTRGEWTVFAARGDRAQLTRVEVGHSDGHETEILQGLTAGDAVILHPSDKVVDGVAIAVRKGR